MDMDLIWMMVSGCPKYIKPDRLKNVVFNVRDRLLECVEYRIGSWKNAYVVGGYPLVSERDRLIRRLGAKEIYIDSKAVNQSEYCSCINLNGTTIGSSSPKRCY